MDFKKHHKSLEGIAQKIFGGIHPFSSQWFEVKEAARCVSTCRSQVNYLAERVRSHCGGGKPGPRSIGDSKMILDCLWYRRYQILSAGNSCGRP
jgi:hypothetical protein